jgi:hypothetical protein
MVLVAQIAVVNACNRLNVILRQAGESASPGSRLGTRVQEVRRPNRHPTLTSEMTGIQSRVSSSLAWDG